MLANGLDHRLGQAPAVPVELLRAAVERLVLLVVQWQSSCLQVPQQVQQRYIPVAVSCWGCLGQCSIRKAQKLCLRLASHKGKRSDQ
jgi:hypothetical protein